MFKPNGQMQDIILTYFQHQPDPKNNYKCGSRGGTGGQDPPGKSQVIWVSIGNKQLDPPPPPWKKLDSPPPPGKCWTPSGTLKND